MNENVELETVDELEFVELGDSAVETKQTAPAPFFTDSQFGWGYTA